MQIGDYIIAKTNAEFLNKLIHTNYKQWYKSSIPYGYNRIIWFVHLDNKSRSGWRNYLEGNQIIEVNEYSVDEWGGNPMYKVCGPNRVTFSIEQTDSGLRKYVYVGNYTYDKKDSDYYSIHYWERIEDTFYI